MSNPGSADGWVEGRTTFQRVYDVLVAAEAFIAAAAVAERARCSETAAREAAEQLVEMGIVERRAGRPARYRRNAAYLRWRRVESLARGHGATELRDRLAALIEEDRRFQERYGVPGPDAVGTADLATDDEEAVFERFEALGEWRTVRRDIRILRRAIVRVEARADEAARA